MAIIKYTSVVRVHVSPTTLCVCVCVCVCVYLHEVVFIVLLFKHHIPYVVNRECIVSYCENIKIYNFQL